MGCGCGGKRKSIKIRGVQTPNGKRICPKCNSRMNDKQVYSAKKRGYIKTWECPKCKVKIIKR